MLAADCQDMALKYLFLFG